MPLFFSYSEFCVQLNEGYYDPPENDSFVEKFEAQLEILENTFRYDNISSSFNSDLFWETINEQDCWKIFDEFNNSIETKTDDLYQKVYVSGFDKKIDNYIYTEEYKRVRKATEEKNTKKPRGLTNIALERALVENLFVKYPKEFWPIYEKAIQSMHNLRGRIKGKKFDF